jgi:hypothetical protein
MLSFSVVLVRGQTDTNFIPAAPQETPTVEYNNNHSVVRMCLVIMTCYMKSGAVSIIAYL